MKNLPKVAIVGRPNVGKSALFNRICSKRISIVNEQEGVTRDRLYAETSHQGKSFILVDTGGIDPKSKADFNDEIRSQAILAIEEADSIIMVVDGRVGLTDLDIYLAKHLRKTQKPVCLAVNKIDDHSHIQLLNEFYSLGIERIIGVSALHGFQVQELLDTATAKLPLIEEVESEPEIKVAIVGRANVGKSTLINTILDDNRCIVSPIAGTTRDSIDCHVRIDSTLFTFIDTAGIRRKHKEHDVLDKFAFMRTQKALERADIALLVLDATQGMTVQEKKIAQLIEETGKGCVLFLNKWDLVKGFGMEHCLQSLKTEVPFLAHCPTIVGSAQTGRNVDHLIEPLKTVHQNFNRRISTGELNRAVEKAIQLNHPPMIKGKRLRIYYLAQVDVAPPKFILFINQKQLMMESWKRYLFQHIRQSFEFTGVPLRAYLKAKKARDNTQKQAPKELKAFEETKPKLDENDYDLSYDVEDDLELF